MWLRSRRNCTANVDFGGESNLRRKQIVIEASRPHAVEETRLGLLSSGLLAKIREPHGAATYRLGSLYMLASSEPLRRSQELSRKVS